MEYYKQYPSGLRLVAKRLDGFYTVSFGIYVNVGSSWENEQTNGFAHFIEHLLFKGTPTRTAQKISEEMDDIGANINAFTSKDSTCFYTKCISKDLEKCVDVLSDMYINALIPQDELDKERGVVLEEISMSEDTPDDISAELISQALYFDQPLGLTILGNPNNIKYSDRHSILEFKNKHYIPSETVITVAGNFDFDTLDKLVLDYFEAHLSDKADLPHIAEPISQYTSKFLSRFKDIQQSHLQIAFPGCEFNSEDSYALTTLCSILGGGQSSRLHQTIREKNGLAYAVYAYPSFYRKSGTFEIYAGVAPENIGKCCELMADEINKLLHDGVTQAELDRAKMQAVNSLLMSSESNLTLMRAYGRAMLKADKVFSIDENRLGYERLTVDDLNEAARKYMTRPFALSYVGPKCDASDAICKITIK